MNTIDRTSPRLLSAHDVADMLGVSAKWVYNRALTGELPFAHLGDSPRSPLRADARAIAAWIDERMPAAAVGAEG
jgi:predicted DNA-binding transcriptional regulator AlpA